jgi:hypothetical protein
MATDLHNVRRTLKAAVTEHNRHLRYAPLADFGSVRQAGLSPRFGGWAKEASVRPRPNYRARTLC